MVFILLLVSNIIFGQENISIKSIAPVNVTAQRILSGQGVIWGMDFISENEIIFTERQGQIKVYNLKTKQLKKIKGVPKVAERGQGGLLDILLAKESTENHRLYITYSIETSQSQFTTVLALVELKDDQLLSHKIMFQAMPSTGNSVHFGSRLQQDKNGYLFMTVGDRGERDLAQDLKTHLGKVLRFKPDGGVPADNPFTHTKDTKPEIWSYGHRNPQGLYISDDELYLNEHGPRGGDEINRVLRGKNYGWPVVTYGREYHGPSIGKTKASGIEMPLYQYTPSIAPSGLIRYSGKKIPEWRGSFFSGALALVHLNRLYQEGGQWKEERLLASAPKRIRNVKESPSGDIYFTTDNGEIYKIAP